MRGSAGAVFRVPLGRFEEATGRRVALVAHGGEPLAEIELRGATVFVLGAERGGLPPEVTARCDAVASISLARGAESLNVAAAGAIALYEWSRRTGLPGTAATSASTAASASGEPTSATRARRCEC